MKKYSVIPEKHRKQETPDVSEEVLDIVSEVSDLLQEHWEESGYDPIPPAIAECYVENKSIITAFLVCKADELGLTAEELSQELLDAANIMRCHALMMTAVSKTL